MNNKPILVTGSYRSGTTWVGRMIAASPLIGYIHEPFNINKHSRARCDANFKYGHTYISKENEDLYFKPIKKTLNFSYNLVEGLRISRSPLDVLTHFKEYYDFSIARILHLRPLMKDPIALFSAEWLASKFNMDVIVLIRHPAAFAESIKRKNWGLNFFHILKQPLLMKDHLYPFQDEIKKYAITRPDIIDQAILFWKLAYYMVSKYQEKHNNWLFIRHEDLCRDPIFGFKQIYNKLNIRYTKFNMNFIKKNTSEDPKSRLIDSYKIKRDSLSTIWNWKKRLTKKEIHRIKTQVEDVSSLFYTDDDW